MISRLKNGDLVFQSDDFRYPNSKPEEAAIYENALESFLSSAPDHGMIFKDDRIYHSSEGDHQAGVRSHEVNAAIKSTVPLGAIQVMRCKDEALRQRFADTMARWDPVEFRESLRGNQVRGKGVVKLPTPFIDFMDRTSDPEEQSAKCELYRALRAYQRNHVSPPQPLSQKGVSCGNFIAYSFKAAIVDQLFPEGIPNEILAKLNEIEAARKPANHKKLKLSEVAEQFDHLDELMRLVEKHAAGSKNYVDFLKITVKGTSVDEFCEKAIEFPAIWEFKGYMFYLRDKGKNIPCVMNHAAFNDVGHERESTGLTPSLLQSLDDIKSVVKNVVTDDIEGPIKVDKNKNEDTKGSSFKMFDKTKPVTADPANIPTFKMGTRKKG